MECSSVMAMATSLVKNTNSNLSTVGRRHRSLLNGMRSHQIAFPSCAQSIYLQTMQMRLKINVGLLAATSTLHCELWSSQAQFSLEPAVLRTGLRRYRLKINEFVGTRVSLFRTHCHSWSQSAPSTQWSTSADSCPAAEKRMICLLRTTSWINDHYALACSSYVKV